MSILSMFNKAKNKGNKKLNQIIKDVNSKHVAYAVSRDKNGKETVLGKNGCINIIKNDESIEIAVLCEGKYVFRGDLTKCEVGQLMSGNGVIIKGYNIISEQLDTVTANYTYHRK